MTSYAYGALYLNRRETLEDAIAQVEKILARLEKPHSQVTLFFDIIASRAQVKEGIAHQVGLAILEYVDEHYPNLAGRVVGITDTDRVRPCRDGGIQGNEQVDNLHQFFLHGNDLDNYPWQNQENNLGSGE